MSNFIAILLSICAIQVINAHALTLTLTLARVFNLAHVALFGLGAYCAGISALRFQFSFVESIAIATFLPALLANFIALIALRRRQDQIALITLGLNLILISIFTNYRSLTGGASGLVGVPIAQIFGYSLEDPVAFAVFCWACTAGCLLILWQLRRSTFGCNLIAQADHPAAAESVGLNLTSLRRNAFVLSGSLCGLAGALSAYRLGLVSPSSFGFSELALLLMIVVLGRGGKFWSTTIAAILLSALPEVLRLIPFWQSLGAQSAAWIQLANSAIVYFSLRTFGASYFETGRVDAH